MTIWTPDLTRHGGPRYRAIASALQDDVVQGRLQAGTRLPTHRDLAYRLGVTVGTVTRAYAEAERRGLIGGEVGRGTFVRDPRRGGPAEPAVPSAMPERDPASPLLDLSINAPSVWQDLPPLRAAMQAVALRGDLGSLLNYQPTLGLPRLRAAGASWIRQTCGLQVAPENVVLSMGGQGAMHFALAALTRPGDVVLAEQLTYAGIKALCGHLGLRVVPVAMDQHGLLPDAVEQACRQHGARALYTMPTLHNPTTATLSEERRRELVAVARRNNLFLLEDDVYGYLIEDRLPTLASMAPDITCFITSASKSLAPGFRVGFLAVPRDLIDRVATVIRGTMHDSAHIGAAVVAELVESGAGLEVAQARRLDIRARQRHARSVLGIDPAGSHPAAPHIWLQLPDPWRREDFARELLNRGIKVTPADVFAAGRVEMPHAVRVCIGAIDRQNVLDQALRTIADLLQSAPCQSALTP